MIQGKTTINEGDHQRILIKWCQMLKLPILYRNYNIEQIKTETQFILLKLRQVANYLGGASGVG